MEQNNNPNNNQNNNENSQYTYVSEETNDSNRQQTPPPTGNDGGNQQQTPPPADGQVPGKGMAVASLVLGIVSVVLWFFGYSAIGSVILGIIGLVLASKSKQEGYNENMRTAGFVLSLIGVIGGAFIFIVCVACIGIIGLSELGSSL